MLKRTSMREVCVKKPMAGYAGNAFEANGSPLNAVIQPMSGTAAAQIYGLRPDEMRMLLASKDAALSCGDGVCVDVPEDADPDYRVVYVALWSRHMVAHLRFIPEGDRGADE